jgi:hypothetical protein
MLQLTLSALQQWDMPAAGFVREGISNPQQAWQYEVVLVLCECGFCEPVMMTRYCCCTGEEDTTLRVERFL